MGEDSRDILIELRADMKHVRDRVDHLASSDGKQWEKIDAIGREVGGHEKSIAFLTKGFWASFTAVLTGAVAIGVWIVNHYRAS